MPHSVYACLCVLCVLCLLTFPIYFLFLLLFFFLFTSLPIFYLHLPSVLWRCWLGSRKGIWSLKNWVVGCWCGYLSGVRCILHMLSWCYCHSMSLARVNPDWFYLPGLTFLVPAHPGSPGHSPGGHKTVVVVVVVPISLSSRIGLLLFEAGHRKRRPNLVLVYCVYFVLYFMMHCWLCYYRFSCYVSLC